MNDAWIRWLMQTARQWDDISDIIRETGIEVIDHDHRKMIEYAFQLNQILSRNRSNSVNIDLIGDQSQLLWELYRYTRMHFSREEELIQDFHLQNYEFHKEQHKRILLVLQNMIHDFVSGRISISSNLKMMILDWIITHINETDRDTFLIENFRPLLNRSTTWEEVKTIIRPTGIIVIDDQHRKMTELTLSLHQLIGSSPNEKELKNRIGELIDYASLHFQTEEDFIRTHSIDGLDQQKNQHRKFLELIDTYRQDLSKRNLNELKTIILEWWINHINHTDFNTFNLRKWAHRIFQSVTGIDEAMLLIRKTGIEPIDREHRILIEKSFELIQSIEKSDPENRADQQASWTILEEICRFAADHFHEEETRMKTMTGSPVIDRHLQEHRQILAMLHDHLNLIREGKIRLSAGFKVKLFEWWINHTNDTDYLTFCQTT
jgi:hemerythrin-like metal-binding protein